MHVLSHHWRFVALASLFLFSSIATAQNLGINTTGAPPDPSSSLDVSATDKGVLIPRIALTALNSANPVVAPATSLLVYNTATAGNAPNNVEPGYYYWNGSQWVRLNSNSIVWKTTGNAGTDPAQNFLGTTDNQPLLFKVNNEKAGIIPTNEANSLFLGLQAGSNNSTGESNTAFGNKALFGNTVGNGNIAIGVGAGLANTTGSNNIFLGNNTGKSINSSNNIFMGNDAGVNFQSGESNVAIGTRAGDFPKSGGGNTYLGRSAGSFWHYYNIDDLNLNNNTYIGNNAGLDAWGSNNTSIGTEAGALGVNNNTYLGYAAGGGFNARGRSSGGGSNNTSLGYGAGSPGSGGYNVFVGHYAGTRSSGNNNIAIGASAGLKTPEGSGQFAVPIGSNNIFIGDSTGQSNNANNNILIGSKTGYQNTTGIHNAALGTRALFNNTTGSYNTAYGFHAGPNTTDLTNSGAFGNEAATTASNQIRLGNSNVTQIGGQVGWSNFSDQRFKRQVQENVAGLDFILKLRPVTYHWDIDHLNRFIHGSAADTLFTDSIARSGIANQQRIAYSGFLAQEVEAAARSVGYDFSGVVAPANERTPYSLRYGEFVVPLVKAVQEQQRQLGQQSQVLAGLNARLERPVVRLTSADEWADRVFEPGYRLRPLAEVESYLREHRHLPGVPSAQVLAEQGVDVSGMLAKQMEKIEELTLYVVEADKKNEALQAENEFIKATTENALRLIEELQQEMKALRSEVSAQK